MMERKAIRNNIRSRIISQMEMKIKGCGERDTRLYCSGERSRRSSRGKKSYVWSEKGLSARERARWKWNRKFWVIIINLCLFSFRLTEIILFNKRIAGRLAVVWRRRPTTPHRLHQSSKLSQSNSQAPYSHISFKYENNNNKRHDK